MSDRPIKTHLTTSEIVASSLKAGMMTSSDP